MIQDTFFADLASLVREHRKQSGLTRIELAELAGVGKTVIYDLEHAKQTVRLDTLIKILKVLNITLAFKGPFSQTALTREAIP